MILFCVFYFFFSFSLLLSRFLFVMTDCACFRDEG